MLQLLPNRTHTKLCVSLIETSDTALLELFVKETDGLQVLSSWLGETGRQGTDKAAMKHVRLMLKTLMHLADSCGAALYGKMKEQGVGIGKTVKRLHNKHKNHSIQKKAGHAMERLRGLIPTKDKTAYSPKGTEAMPATMERHGSSDLSEDELRAKAVTLLAEAFVTGRCDPHGPVPYPRPSPRPSGHTTP